MTATFDLLAAVQIVLAIATFLFGWLLKVLFERIDKLETADSSHASHVASRIDKLEGVDAQLVREVGQTRLELASNYVHKSDLQHIMAPIYDTLRRIEDKLDKKVDKEGS